MPNNTTHNTTHNTIHNTTDTLEIAGLTLQSRFFLGTAGYPSPADLQASIESSGTELVTVGIKRQTAEGMAQGQAWWSLIRQTGRHLLPNTAGCRTAQEAILLAHIARDIFETPRIKLEVVGDDYSLQPDPIELVKAAEVLVADGFTVFPYCTEDVVTARRLVQAGCNILMPWGAPIGSGQGLANPSGLRRLRAAFPEVAMVVDAGIGAPSHAAMAMEMGMDAVLLNSAVSQAANPASMAWAFGSAVAAGRQAFLSGVIPPQEFATPSTNTGGGPMF